MKRWRTPEAKKGELKVAFGKDCGELDLFYCWPENESGMKGDSRLLMKAIEGIEVYESNSLRKELEKRGYDITTLKFTIQKKDTNND